MIEMVRAMVEAGIVGMAVAEAQALMEQVCGDWWAEDDGDGCGYLYHGSEYDDRGMVVVGYADGVVDVCYHDDPWGECPEDM